MSILNFFTRSKIKDQLKLSSQKITKAIDEIFIKKKLSSDILQDLEEMLISADVGVSTSQKIKGNIAQKKFDKDVSVEEIKKMLSDEIYKILKPHEKKLFIDNEEFGQLQTLIFNGVNGAGKTTTIGKIAFNLSNKNNKVLIAACDTFRAAAKEQLDIWAKRASCEIILPIHDKEDPAAVAYRAFDYAKKNNFNILLIDTAGRLQNKQNLMDELKKINNVIKKIDLNADCKNILIIDATSGQNAKNQLDIFDKTIFVDGLILTKLDGSSKGGCVIGLCDYFKKPIFAIGLGESIEDLQDFDADEFIKNLLDIK